MKAGQIVLILASLLAFAASLFQAAIVIEPRWSAAVGAPAALVSNPPMLLASGLLVAVILALLGLYGLSGAGVIRRLPLLRLGLAVNALGYMLVGINLIPLLLAFAGVIPALQPIGLLDVGVTGVAFLTSLLFLAGLMANWKRLARRAPAAAEPAAVHDLNR